MTSLLPRYSPKEKVTRPSCLPVSEQVQGDQKHVAFIGNIPTNAEKADVQSYLIQFNGFKHLSLPIDLKTRRHKGYAKAFFLTEKDLTSAINFPHHEIMGVNVAIQKWVPRSQFTSKKALPSPKKIFFRLFHDFKQEELLRFFRRFGNIESFEIKSDREMGRKRNFGFVTYDSEDAAQSAIEYGPDIVMGQRRIIVTPSKSNKQIGKEIKSRTKFEKRNQKKKEPETLVSLSGNQKIDDTDRYPCILNDKKRSIEGSYAQVRNPDKGGSGQANCPAIGDSFEGSFECNHELKPSSKMWNHNLICSNHGIIDNLSFRVAKMR